MTDQHVHVERIPGRGEPRPSSGVVREAPQPVSSKYMVMSSSDLGNRWDAGFHYVRAALAPRVAELEAEPHLTVSEIMRRVLALPSGAWQVLKPLSRQNVERLGEREVRGIVLEYPHLALARIHSCADELRSLYQQKLDELQASLHLIDTITEAEAPVKERSSPRPAG